MPVPTAQTTLERTVEPEAMILGALLTENRLVDRVATKLTPVHFSEHIFGRIYGEICAMVDAGLTANPITVARRFGNDAGFRSLGGASYLARLTADPHAEAGIGMADHVIEMAQRRFLSEALREAMEDVENTSIKLDDAISTVGDAMNFAVDPGVTDSAQSLGEAFADARERIEKQRRGELEAGVCLKCLSDWTSLVGGMEPGQMILLAGRPSMGKTAVSLGVALSAAREGYGVLYISREMITAQLMTRVMADLLFEAGGSATFDDIRNGRIGDDDLITLCRIERDVKRWPLTIISPDRLSATQITPLIRRYQRSFELRGVPLKVVIIDYLGLVDPPPGRPNREQEVSAISQTIKSAAKSTKTTIITLSQLSRAVEQREDKRPQLSDLRDSGSLEQDADVVVFVYREEYYLARSEPDQEHKRRSDWEQDMQRARNRLDLIVSKNRQGQTASRRGYFYGAHQAVRSSDFHRQGGF